MNAEQVPPSQPEGVRPPCDDCPNKTKTRLTKVAIVVYTGGPPHAQYVALAQAIPPRDEKVLLQYGWPTTRPDGCLEYRGGQVPPVSEGYEATADPHVLKPVWPFCTHRVLQVQMNNDSGLLHIDGLCMNPGSGKKGHEKLTVAHCQECRVRRPIQPLNVKLGVSHPGLVGLGSHQLKDPALGKVHQLAPNRVDGKLP
jgi:hypothetical protein